MACTTAGRILLLPLIAVALILMMISCGENRKSSEATAVEANDTISDELARLNALVEANPSGIPAYLERARFFARSGMENEALQDVNKALSLNENDPEVYAGLSDVYMYTGKMQRSLDALKKAVELNPRAGKYDVMMARLYLTMSDYKQTFNALREGLRKDPDNAEAFFISGLANEEMGDTLKAIDSYQMAVAKNQDHYDALKQLGILMSIRKDRLAIDYLRNAARVKPGSPDPLYILGMFYQDNEDPDKALAVYEEILMVDPSFTFAHYNKGYIFLVFKEMYPEAVEAFSKAIELNPDYADAWYNRGYAHELMGNVSSARSDYERVLRMKTNDDKAIRGLNRLDQL